MCGRGAYTLDPSHIRNIVVSGFSPPSDAKPTGQAFAKGNTSHGADVQPKDCIEWIDEEQYQCPMYNATLTHYLPVLRASKNSESSLPTIQSMRWGLVPKFAKDTFIDNKMANARCETLLQKPSFKGLVYKKRGLLLLDGFYEWRRAGPGKSLPYFIKLSEPGEVMLLAVLFDDWKSINI